MRQIVRCMLVASGLLWSWPWLGALAPASAQGRLEARYTATIAGIPIGSGTWAIDVADMQYTAAASGSTSGLLRAFTGGQGDSTARGTLNGGRPLSSTYAVTISSRKKSDVIRFTHRQWQCEGFAGRPAAG